MFVTTHVFLSKTVRTNLIKVNRCRVSLSLLAVEKRLITINDINNIRNFVLSDFPD